MRDDRTVLALAAAIIVAITFCLAYSIGRGSVSPEPDGFYCARRHTETGRCDWYVRRK